MAMLGLLPLLNRIDALIEKLDEYLKAIGAIPTPGVPAVPTVVVTTPRLSNRYEIITVDLNVVHTDEAIGIKELKPTTGYISYMTILVAGAAFTFKMNSTGMKSITGTLGLEVVDFEITEIYIMNAAGGVGTQAVFYLEYRVD